jgi:hypothetical protein
MNPKDKGNQFERKISKLFSERFKIITGIDQSFRRAIDSGSFFGGSNQKRTNTHDLTKATFGDIVCPPKFLFNIECKHYKLGPSFASIIKQSCKDWDKWIMQSTQDSINAKRKPLLIIKYNGVDEFVILPQLPINLEFTLRYKESYITTLDKFLLLPDSEFFEI